MTNATAIKSATHKASKRTPKAEKPAQPDINHTAPQVPALPLISKLDDAMRLQLHKLGEDCAISEILAQESQEAFNTIFGMPGLAFADFEARRIEWVRGYMGKMETGADAAKMAFSRRCRAGQIDKPISVDPEAQRKAEQRAKAAEITAGIIAKYTPEQLRSKADAAHAAGDKSQRKQFEDALALKLKADKAEHEAKIKELRSAITERVKKCDQLATLEAILAKLPE